MSWRQESTFKPTSKLDDWEKEFLKQAKKYREVQKLEERIAKGESLEDLQRQKVAAKDDIVKELVKLSSKLPPGTQVFEKNQDIRELLPSDTLDKAEQKKAKAERDSQRREVEHEKRREQSAYQYIDRHMRPIVDIAVSADCKYLYTCSKDKYVLCWSLKDALLRCVCTFAGHTGAVWGVDISPAGQLLSGSADEKVHLWKGEPPRNAVRHGEEAVAQPLRSLNHGGIVRVVRWCPFDSDGGEGRRFASASEKMGSKPARIAVWRVSDRGDFSNVLELTELPTKANDLRWSSGGKLKLLSAHDNGYVGVWSAEAPGSLMKTIKLHSGPVSWLHLAQGGSVLVTASHDKTAVAVDITKPATPTLATYKASRPLNCVVVSSDFQASEAGYLVVGGGKDPLHVTTSKVEEGEFDSTIIDAKSGEPVGQGEISHFGPVHALLELPQLGKYGAYASASEDGFIYVHGLDGKCLHKDTK